eukprot:CAMPEP_0114274110 /NCGR_PEP_ID=MMETSP0058-20121206/29547_1 /TAXON_ID=36894 /ORGANISM="Pyramimonas parkeae, CCMP726" /LENGTH=325 /DNA_ID=CAMNT_0001393793 /DNA_START=70 /DNA_END=1047 /DNA_ORIENTATION=-
MGRRILSTTSSNFNPSMPRAACASSGVAISMNAQHLSEFTLQSTTGILPGLASIPRLMKQEFRCANSFASGVLSGTLPTYSRRAFLVSGLVNWLATATMVGAGVGGSSNPIAIFERPAGKPADPGPGKAGGGGRLTIGSPDRSPPCSLLNAACTGSKMDPRGLAADGMANADACVSDGEGWSHMRRRRFSGGFASAAGAGCSVTAGATFGTAVSLGGGGKAFSLGGGAASADCDLDLLRRRSFLLLRSFSILDRFSFRSLVSSLSLSLSLPSVLDLSLSVSPSLRDDFRALWLRSSWRREDLRSGDMEPPPESEPASRSFVARPR